MMQESCNTSTDILLRLIGGPLEVMQFLINSDIQDMRIDRYTIEIMADNDGIENLPEDYRLTLAQYKELEKSVAPSTLLKAKEKFKKAVRDTATPPGYDKTFRKTF